MIIPSVNFLKSNSLKYQNQPLSLGSHEPTKMAKKYLVTSKFWRYSCFLVAGLTCLIMTNSATPAVAQPRIIEQFLDLNNRQNVRSIQDALRRLGYFRNFESNGSFEEPTRQAVLDFQRDYELPVTGVVDNITANRIFAKAQENGWNDLQNIRAIQEGLRRRGYSISVDGIFGPQTQQALVNFQRSNNLPATGVVDPITANAIFDGNRSDGNRSFALSSPPDGNRERFCSESVTRNQVCPYVVLVPGDNNRLQEVRRQLQVSPFSPLADNLILEDHPRGLFIRINQYPNRAEAEVVASALRNNVSPNFRVEYLPSVIPVSSRG